MAESLSPKGLPDSDIGSDASGAPYLITPATDPDEAGPEAPPTIPCGTAFLVVVTASGAAQATNDLSIADQLEPARPAGIDDMHRAILEVDRDLTIARTAQETVALVSMQAQAMQQQQEELALRQQVLGKGGFNPAAGRRR